MINHGFPQHWSTIKKLIWAIGSGIAGAAAGIWKTVTGTLIHITDALASPMQKCEVSLEPIQDLHGQDAPYPAGGGKNKWNPASTPDVVGLYWVWYIPFQTSMKVTLTDNDSTADISGCYFGVSTEGTAGGMEWLVQNGSINARTKSFTTKPYICVYTKSEEVIQKLLARFNIMVAVDADIDAPYSPVENICPITGWTGCEVNVTGVNVWDEEWENGYYDVATGNPAPSSSYVRSKSTNYISVVGGASYYLVNASGVGSIVLLWYDADKHYISNTSGKDVAKTAPANARYARFYIGNSAYGTTYNNDISINYPSTDTDYHAYQGKTASVTFPDTVYGGKYNFVDGKGDSNLAEVDLGTLTWEYVTNDGEPYFQAFADGRKYATNYVDIICSMYKTSVNTGTGYINDFEIGCSGSNNRVFVKDSRYTDAATFKTAMSGVQLVYELAIPIEIQLTPQEISTLAGENNVWSNGDSVEITYKAQSS